MGEIHQFQLESVRSGAQIVLMFKLGTQICHVLKQDSACFERNFSVSSASYITTLLTMDHFAFMHLSVKHYAFVSKILNQ